MEIVPIPETELEHLVTPFFRHQTIENVPQSEIQKRPVMEVHEVVELRFAGDKNYAPILPIHAMYRRDGHQVITYAERFAEQYRAFVTGAPQEAEGTPLEMLKPYGISENQISLCRVLKIYSIEALHALEGQNVKNLGMSANDLKRMAAAYMADRAKGLDTAAELEALRRQVAELTAGVIPPEQASPEAVAAATEAADAEASEFASFTDAEIKAWIKAETGSLPRGFPKRETLIRLAEEIEAGKAA